MYQIDPIDNFFFRSASPFEFAGETSIIGNIFPPHPSTYAGALKEFATAKHMRIGFNGIAIENEFCFPIPLDLITFEKNVKREEKILAKYMSIKKTPLSSFPLQYSLCDSSAVSGKVKNLDDLYIYYEDMHMYVHGNNCEFTCFQLSDYIIKEQKIGIAIDRQSNTSKDKHLYQIQMIRPKCGLKLVLDVQNISLKKEELIKLGGESKLSRINMFQKELMIAPPPKESLLFKLYFATPAIFKNGWLPAWIDPNTYIGRFSYKDKSVTVQLITAAVGKKIPIGGFGYEGEYIHSNDKEINNKNRPKEMRFAVPAGSVYYFKLLEGSYHNVITLFNQKCISDYRDTYGFQYPTRQYNRIKYCDRGFGYAIVCAIDKCKEEMLQCIM